MDTVIALTSVFALIIGLAVTFFGERIFKISLSSTGFAVGAVLAGGVLYNVSENIIITLIAAVIAGFISMLLVRSAYRTGMFIIGFAMSAIITSYIAWVLGAINIDVQNLQAVNQTTLQSLFPLIIGGVFLSIVTGSLVVIFDTPILRIVTAIFGALLFAISGFILTTGMDSLPETTASLVSVPLFVWGLGWIPLAIVGVIFQFFGVNWLFRFLQIDQASRHEQARRRAYYQQKQRPPAQRPPTASGQAPTSQRPQQRRPNQQQPPPRRKP